MTREIWYGFGGVKRADAGARIAPGGTRVHEYFRWNGEVDGYSADVCVSRLESGVYAVRGHKHEIMPYPTVCPLVEYRDGYRGTLAEAEALADEMFTAMLPRLAVAA